MKKIIFDLRHIADQFSENLLHFADSLCHHAGLILFADKLSDIRGFFEIQPGGLFDHRGDFFHRLCNGAADDDAKDNGNKNSKKEKSDYLGRQGICIRFDLFYGNTENKFHAVAKLCISQIFVHTLIGIFQNISLVVVCHKFLNGGQLTVIVGGQVGSYIKLSVIHHIAFRA